MTQTCSSPAAPIVPETTPGADRRVIEALASAVLALHAATADPAACEAMAAPQIARHFAELFAIVLHRASGPGRTW